MASPIQSWIQAVFSTVSGAVGEAEDDKALQENFLQLNRAALREDALAADTLRRGSFVAGLKRMEGTATIAQQKVAYEASGVDSTSGTAAQVAASTRIVSELDAKTLENNAVRAALGHTEAATQHRNEWKAQVRARDARRTKRALDTASSFLNVIGGAAGGDLPKGG